jgi:hypothetical protein
LTLRRRSLVALTSALVAALLPHIADADPSAATYVTVRVYATQYAPNTPGSVEVAVPDRCAKFAALGWSSTLRSHNCPSGYAVGNDWRVFVKRDGGQSAFIPLRDVGPWNIDDNFWDPPSGTRPRRLFTDLPAGVPEAQAAYQSGYNTVPNCLLLSGSPSGHAGAADQFGRCVRNPSGIDLSVQAAAVLGLSYLQNEWVTVSFLWEPVGSAPPPPPPPASTPAPTPAPHKKGTLRGAVYLDGTRQPLKGATMCESGPEPSASMSCAKPTSKKGTYSDGVRPGEYTLMTTFPGYECRVEPSRVSIVSRTTTAADAFCTPAP